MRVTKFKLFMLMCTTAALVALVGCSTGPGDEQTEQIQRLADEVHSAVAEHDWLYLASVMDQEALGTSYAQGFMDWLSDEDYVSGLPTDSPYAKLIAAPPEQMPHDAIADDFLANLETDVTTGMLDERSGWIDILSADSLTGLVTEDGGETMVATFESADSTPKRLDLRLVRTPDGWIVAEIINPKQLVAATHAQD